MTMTINNNNNKTNGQNMGDTTLTKVFVGGLAWETQKEAMRTHFEKFGDILEAVIIQDKVTGRSKGYGFVTFKDAEAANKACEDAAPIINGRRANCNLASLGAKRSRASTPTPPQQGAISVGPRANNSTAPTSQQVQWYYPTGAAPPPAATPFHHQHHQPVPFYGYSPTYIATDMNYNHKMGYTGGSYTNGHYSQVYPAQAMIGANTLMPMYPLYHYHQSQTMGLPAHMYATRTGPITAMTPMIRKPISISPNAGTQMKP